MIVINNDYAPDKCPLCKSSNLSRSGIITYTHPTLFSSNEISISHEPELWRCNNCKSAFVKNVANEFDAIDLYSKGESSERWKSNSSFEDSKTQNVVSILDNLFRGGTKNVLDIGCNTGELLDFAQRRGCRTYGLEYSSSSLEIIKAKGHIAFSTMDEIKESFNLIVAFDLIEHLYNVPCFLSRCYELLEPGGRLILLTGNINSQSAILLRANWWYVKYPEHIVFPSKIYFERYTNFHVVYWFHVYHSRYFYTPISLRLKVIASHLIKSRIYLGVPPILPDHVLVILKKKI